MKNRTRITRAILMLAFWVLIPMGGTHAGTCRIYSEGSDTVEACKNGAYTVTDRHGHRRVYGEMNGGFERYPEQGERPVYRRREDWAR
jgi:hypothetical protein